MGQLLVTGFRVFSPQREVDFSCLLFLTYLSQTGGELGPLNPVQYPCSLTPGKA